MNSDEHIVEAYLRSLDIGQIIHEPDGKVPPDFLINGRIAVEVRRLNQHYETGGKIRGLEQDTIPLHQRFDNLLAEFVTPNPAATWFVLFNFHRPLADWRELRPQVRDALRRFLQVPVDNAWRIPINDAFTITTLRASTIYDRCFLLGGYTDMDSGGWVVSEIIRNASAYIADKTQKVSPYLSKYPSWWLVFVDYIGHGSDEADVRQHISCSKPWDRVLILNPLDARAYEI